MTILGHDDGSGCELLRFQRQGSACHRRQHRDRPRHGSSFPGISPYIAAKHAVIGLTKAAAIEYASRGIRINALAPGLVQTGMTRHWLEDENLRTHLVGNTPIGRVAQPEEIAGMVLFLCSDLATFTAGHAFVVDGGYTAH